LPAAAPELAALERSRLVWSVRVLPLVGVVEAGASFMLWRQRLFAAIEALR
jgi:hypothetical protein